MVDVGKEVAHGREEGEDGRAVPWCRDAAFPQDSVAQGYGFLIEAMRTSDVRLACLEDFPCLRTANGHVVVVVSIKRGGRCSFLSGVTLKVSLFLKFCKHVIG